YGLAGRDRAVDGIQDVRTTTMDGVERVRGVVNREQQFLVRIRAAQLVFQKKLLVSPSTGVQAAFYVRIQTNNGDKGSFQGPIRVWLSHGHAVGTGVSGRARTEVLEEPVE